MLVKQKVKLGCAPINWSNDDLPAIGERLTFEQCLSEMALAGFEGSEIGHKYPKNVDELSRAVQLRNLEICNGWFSCYFTSKPIEETINAFSEHIDTLEQLGAEVVGVGEVGSTIHNDITQPLFLNRPQLTDEQFDYLCEGLNQLGQMAKERGMALAFHYHIGTGIETMEEIDRVMEGTDSNLVHLLYDTGHATIAGVDPVQLLYKYGDRIRHVHVKDVRKTALDTVKEEDLSFIEGVKLGLFTVPGDGDMVDMQQVLTKLNVSDYSGWIVVEAEQDPEKADPLEYAIKARQYIQTHLGV
ncbi:myo-inosose-2 dehydratase [Halobacillus sp. Cin3]|uniref:myo-inosose-2 dehydratase n=1 Tax=Halobacillus sp. Cin3 TaxID=2928441 RepID=UPI00248DBB19|nr:myo-inosose-2 dehydratase [Halobacillus sp. Cin3]